RAGLTLPAHAELPWNLSGSFRGEAFPGGMPGFPCFGQVGRPVKSNSRLLTDPPNEFSDHSDPAQSRRADIASAVDCQIDIAAGAVLRVCLFGPRLAYAGVSMAVGIEGGIRQVVEDRQLDKGLAVFLHHVRGVVVLRA